MKRKELREIFNLWKQCLSPKWKQPGRLLFCSSLEEMRKKYPIYVDSKKEFGDCDEDDVYYWNDRLEALHSPSKKEGKSKDRRVVVGILDGEDIVVIPSAVRGEVDALITFTHELGHLNDPNDDKDATPLQRRNREKAAGRWMWTRWAFIYGRYLKLKKMRGGKK